jgi:hypothetical protein
MLTSLDHLQRHVNLNGVQLVRIPSRLVPCYIADMQLPVLFVALLLTRFSLQLTCKSCLSKRRLGLRPFGLVDERLVTMDEDPLS